MLKKYKTTSGAMIINMFIGSMVGLITAASMEIATIANRHWRRSPFGVTILNLAKKKNINGVSKLIPVQKTIPVVKLM